MLVDKRYVSVRFNEVELRERNHELSVLLDMSNFLSTSLKLRDVLQGALSKVLEHFNLDAGRIYRVESDCEYLVLEAHQGVETEGLERVHISEGFSGKAARTRSFIAQYVSELEDRRRAELLLKQGFEIVICVPLIALDKVFGVMNLASRKVIELDQAKLDLLITVGNQIAVAANDAVLYENLEKKIEEIREKTETIKFFIYSASHDLKSPAIGVHGITRLLHNQYRELLDERGRRYCDQILRASEQIVALVDRVNAYIAAKEAPLNIERIRVKEIIELIRDEFSVALNQRHIEWIEPETMPEIMGDKLSILRVFRNLIDNALKYGGEKLSRIIIGFTEGKGAYTFFVKDDGVGLGVENSGRLFELFQRYKTSKGIEGSGLGLAIVKEITERHQGKVRVESEPEKGTTFYLSFPVTIRDEKKQDC